MHLVPLVRAVHEVHAAPDIAARLEFERERIARRSDTVGAGVVSAVQRACLAIWEVSEPSIVVLKQQQTVAHVVSLLQMLESHLLPV
jgi:spore cortex formation protein SpoVR/YcgB (stage V sporulation)